MHKTSQKSLGFGLGLRNKHFSYIIENQPTVDWFEIISEDFLIRHSALRSHLDQIRQSYPIVMHGVSLSIGSADPLDLDYLARLKQLADDIEPAWVSDHLCWTGINNKNMHDLLPLPYTQAMLDHLVPRIQQVQDFLGRQLLLENPSSYVSFVESNYGEAEFLAELTQQADCKILLDINNIYVSSFNHGFDPVSYLNAIPVDRVQQFHLAGHLNKGTVIIDTHDAPIIPDVWALYAKAVQRFGDVATMIERDDNIPDFPELYEELQYAKHIAIPLLQECAV